MLNLDVDILTDFHFVAAGGSVFNKNILFRKISSDTMYHRRMKWYQSAIMWYHIGIKWYHIIFLNYLNFK